MPILFENTSASYIFESIRSSISQPYCLIDEAGVVQDANLSFATALGYELEEITGKSFICFIPEKLRPYAQTHHLEFFSQALPAATETWDYLDKSGNIKKFDVISSCIRLEKRGRLKMAILTETKDQQEIQQNSDLTEFKQISRHMFKNTLQEISGLIQLQMAQSQGEVKSLLSLSHQRLNVIVAAYEQLYKYKNYEEIEVSAFLQKVLKFYLFSPAVLAPHPEIYMKIDKCYALGLMLNDVLHASRLKPKSIIAQGKYQGGWYILTLLHTGSGDRPKKRIVDTKLFKALQRQIGAQISDKSAKDTFFELRVPL